MINLTIVIFLIYIYMYVVTKNSGKIRRDIAHRHVYPRKKNNKIKRIERSIHIYTRKSKKHSATQIRQTRILHAIIQHHEHKGKVSRLCGRYRCIECFWVYNLLFDKSGVIYVVDELDYEQKKQYELTVRATDSVSGVYAEVLVSILVLDVNDCPPEFTQDSYNISVSEAAPFGTSVLRVSSRDNDTGKWLLSPAPM